MRSFPKTQQRRELCGVLVDGLQICDYRNGYKYKARGPSIIWHGIAPVPPQFLWPVRKAGGPVVPVPERLTVDGCSRRIMDVCQTTQWAFPANHGHPPTVSINAKDWYYGGWSLNAGI